MEYIRVYKVFSESCGFGRVTDSLVSGRIINTVAYVREIAVKMRRVRRDFYPFERPTG